MDNIMPSPSRHSHRFGQGVKRKGENPSILVTLITAVTMIVEISAGVAFGSMALLADGVHMGSHAIALGIAIIAYIYTRKHADDPRFSFGTGKVNALGGLIGAILLAVFAFIMAWESFQRLLFPISIAFNQAILVAGIGFLVNVLSIFILGHHEHEHLTTDTIAGTHHSHSHHDHNLRSAYLHVMADALTSLFAMIALISGKFLGWTWLDPVMGLVGAMVVAFWSKRLISDTAHILLDMQAPESLRASIIDSLTQDMGVFISDLHIWAIGPDIYAIEAVVEAQNPKPAVFYAEMLSKIPRIVHVTVQVNTLKESYFNQSAPRHA